MWLFYKSQINSLGEKFISVTIIVQIQIQIQIQKMFIAIMYTSQVQMCG